MNRATRFLATSSLFVALALGWAAPIHAEEDDGPEAEGAAQGRSRPRSGAGDPRVLGFEIDGADLEVSAAGGAVRENNVMEDQAAAIEVEARVKPHVHRGRLHLRLPVSFSHRATFGAGLDETAGSIAADVVYRMPGDWRLSAGAGVRGKLRPDWSDPYQDGAPTDRFGYLEAFAATGATFRLGPRQRAKLEYGFGDVAAERDPNFVDTIEMHLTPRSRVKHTAELSWSYQGERLGLGARVSSYWYLYDRVYARDALTGLTHTGAGQTPNPLQELRGAEPAMYVEVTLVPEVLEVRAGYGYELREDPFQGYYSRSGHHPELGLTFANRRGFSAELGLDLWLRRYGPDSAEVSKLEAGATRRDESRWQVEATAAQTLGDAWALFAEGRLAGRRTNFADTSPLWSYDYDNWHAVAGVRWQQ